MCSITRGNLWTAQWRPQSLVHFTKFIFCIPAKFLFCSSLENIDRDQIQKLMLRRVDRCMYKQHTMAVWNSTRAYKQLLGQDWASSPWSLQLALRSSDWLGYDALVCSWIGGFFHFLDIPLTWPMRGGHRLRRPHQGPPTLDWESWIICIVLYYRLWVLLTYLQIRVANHMKIPLLRISFNAPVLLFHRPDCKYFQLREMFVQIRQSWTDYDIIFYPVSSTIC